MKTPSAFTSQELDDLWLKALDAFNQAIEKQGRFEFCCDVAGVAIDLVYAGTALKDAFRPALLGIETKKARKPDGCLFIFDCKSNGIPIPTFDRPIKHLILRRGNCWEKPTVKRHVFFDMSDSTLFIFDPVINTGIVVVEDATQLPTWVYAAPLRTPLALILQKFGVQLVHGAAMGTKEGAILITGYGGSGKSTTTLSCYRAGIPILGDDYVAIKPPTNKNERWQVCNIYASLKIVNQEIKKERIATQCGPKSIFYPFEISNNGLLHQAPLVAFCSASIAHTTETNFVVCHADEVARIAYASTNIQTPCHEEASAQIISNCAKAVGATFKIELGSDRDAVADAIDLFLKESHRVENNRALPTWHKADAMKRISIIITVHNDASYIGEAIKSVVSQGYSDYEMIIVDDGSTDSLNSIERQIEQPFKLIRQAWQGPAAARNAGIKVAGGEWLAFLKADDIWVDGSLLQLARDMVLHPKADVIYGDVVTFKTDIQTGEKINVAHQIQNARFCVETGLYRRTVFQTVGLFDEEIKMKEDLEWFIRAHDAGRFILIPETVLCTRINDTNATNHTTGEPNYVLHNKGNTDIASTRGIIARIKRKHYASQQSI